AVEFGWHALGGNGPQSVQGGERGSVAHVEHPGDARPLIIAQAGDQMAPKPGHRTIADSPDQSLDNRNARQKHLVGDEPRRRSIDQGAGPIVTAPAQGGEPSGQPETRHGIGAKVRETVMRADDGQVSDATTSLEIGVHACRGFKGELLDHDRQDRRWDLGGRNWKRPQKSGARQHHGKAEPIVVAAQSSDEVAVGSVQMEGARRKIKALSLAKSAHPSPHGRPTSGVRSLRWRTAKRIFWSSPVSTGWRARLSSFSP